MLTVADVPRLDASLRAALPTYAGLLYPWSGGRGDPLSTYHDLADGTTLRACWTQTATADQDSQVASIIVAVEAGPTLAEAQAAAIAALHDAAIAFVESRYASLIMARFSLLLIQATLGNRPNQAAYCQALCNWSDSVMHAYAVAVAQVQAATTVADAQAVTIDFAPLAASDPGAVLPVAAAITN